MKITEVLLKHACELCFERESVTSTWSRPRYAPDGIGAQHRQTKSIGSDPAGMLFAAMVPRAARIIDVLMVATASHGVDNLLAADSVSDRLSSGATPLRIEADFVTCSQ